MLRSTLRNLKHVGTAVLLLALGVVFAEIWLQCQTPPRVVTSGIRTEEADLPLLLPSQVSHHEMRRLLNGSSPATSGRQAIRTNSFGLRGAEPVVPCPAGVYRILLLGDDAVAGTQLAESETLSSRLQQLLSANSRQEFEVINGGVPGFSPLLSRLLYERELRNLQPDLIVLHFDMSDVADDAAYRRYLRSGNGGQICSHADLLRSASAAKPLERLLQTSALAAFAGRKIAAFAQGDAGDGLASDWRRSAYSWTLSGPPDLRLQIQHALTPVRELQQVAIGDNSALVVSSSPVFWQVETSDVHSQRSRRYGVVDRNPVTRDLPFQILRKYCDQAGIRLCNATPAFREFASRPATTAPAADALSNSDGAHALFERDSTRLSKYGTALYAREIAAMLLNGMPQSASPIPQSTQRDDGARSHSGRSTRRAAEKDLPESGHRGSARDANTRG